MSNEEFNTEQFLKSDGPPDNVFNPNIPNIPDELLIGKSPDVVWLYKAISESNKMIGVCAKQNEWLIDQQHGLKLCHQVIHTSMKTLNTRMDEETQKYKVQAILMQPFIDWWSKWITRKNLAVTAFGAVLTGVLVAVLSGLVVEWAKHHFKWG